MITYSRASLIVDVAFGYSCEYCDTMNEAAKPTSGTGFALFWNRKGAGKNAVKNLQQKVTRIENKLKRKSPTDLQLVWHAACSSCGYIQSWPVRYVRGRRLLALKIIMIFIALFVPTATGLRGLLCLIPIPLTALVFIYTQMIYHPNEAWLQEHGYTIDTPPAPRAPLGMQVRERQR